MLQHAHDNGTMGCTQCFELALVIKKWSNVSGRRREIWKTTSATLANVSNINQIIRVNRRIENRRKS